ncbi:MAG: hypothetical protein GX885_02220 [Methanomicrobiales archaeon]|nr:hypothetical protein [Methanomicrobiales archaeon]
MKSLTKYFLLVGVVVSLLFSVATAADAETYISMTIDDAAEYRGLRIATVDALDPLETETSLVTIQGDSHITIPHPAFGTITRAFDPASGTYRGVDVTVTENKSLDGSAFPGGYQIYTDRIIPNFTVNVPGWHGNVFLVKLPEGFDEGLNFTTFFEAAKEQGYLFTDDAIIYSNATGISAYGGINAHNYDIHDLNFTLARNEVNLTDFRADGERMMEIWPYTRPEAGRYLLTAINYDCASETLHVLAALPILILDGNPTAIWDDRGAGAIVSFDGEGVDRIAYILLGCDATYDLTMRVDTEALADQPIPSSMADLDSLLRAAAGEAGPVTYVLAPDGTPADVDAGPGIIIAEGYGLSGYADGPVAEIGAEALATLNPGTYALYALGMAGEEIVTVDYQEVEIQGASS